MTKGKIVDEKIGVKSVALYSLSQNCFHIETLIEYINSNLKYLLVTKRKSDWVLIGVFDNNLEAHDYIEIVRAKIKEVKGL